ncbi:MAG: hypothetical protein WCC12_06545 [Anaerolineales bacterium]
MSEDVGFVNMAGAKAQGRAPHGATFEDGYRNAVICDAILESAEHGRQVDIRY